MRLLHVHKVLWKVVDVHQHVVFQILPTAHVVGHGPVGAILHGESGCEHVALVIALSVGVGFGGLAGLVKKSVREAVLLDVLIVGNQAQRQLLHGIPTETQTATSLVGLVGTLIKGDVLEKAVLAVIESRQ